MLTKRINRITKLQRVHDTPLTNRRGEITDVPFLIKEH